MGYSQVWELMVLKINYLNFHFIHDCTFMCYYAAPTAPPSFFHVVVLNSTAVEFQWELPPIEYRNGIVRGFKLFIGQQGITAETTVNVSDPDANEYIVSRLSPATPYVCSMLAYNSADGPRTVYLTVSTFPNGRCFFFYSLAQDHQFFGLNYPPPPSSLI